MGCGGSRADAIEPRYYESWTRETESTWLTNTDSESPAQEGGGAGIREDGKSAQTGVTTASATAGMLNTEKRNSGGPQCVNPMVHGTGATTQKQNVFKAAESKWDAQKMSTKEVTINVTKNIRQSDRRKTKNCVN
ncbi:brain and acute leukemia cytoplasmic protein [Phaenicophaeus curvirostris]|uniref:brain and acute leukemia cytoplasmic protein n=1 Tax=Phaenicophaeus curvirostris TaxID=33595 RepID=UPI0037F0D3E8